METKFTKTQRIIIYKSAKQKLINGCHEFMCHAIDNSSRELYNKKYYVLGLYEISGSEVCFLHFPEMKLIKPDGVNFGSSWFRSREDRISAFDEIIEMTKKATE